MEGDRVVTVHVSTELLAGLREWSPPVRAMVIHHPGSEPEYEMVFQTHECAAIHDHEAPASQ